MHLVVNKEEFIKLLYLSSSVAEKKSTMPIVSNVKISVKDNMLGVAATDLETSITGEISAKVTTPGSITVAAKVLHDIVKDLPSEEITLKTSSGQQFEVTAGQACFKINAISADEFPKIAGINIVSPVSVDAGKLFEMFSKTSFAMSVDETRYSLNGIFTETLDTPIGKDKQRLRFVATDGHRLAMVERPAEGFSLQPGVIIPRKGIQEIRKILEGNEGAAKVSVHEGFLTIESGNIVIGTRLVDGEYPDYRQAIPIEHNTILELEREALMSAVRRVSLVSFDKTKAVKLKVLGGNLTVSSSSQECGEASETISIISQEGEDLTIGFSARYLLELLGAMEDSNTVTVKLNGEFGPGLISGDGDEFYQCMVMPMRFE